jgi:hypothetical protein
VGRRFKLSVYLVVIAGMISVRRYDNDMCILVHKYQIIRNKHCASFVV